MTLLAFMVLRRVARDGSGTVAPPGLHFFLLSAGSGVNRVRSRLGSRRQWRCRGMSAGANAFAT